jgi:hypothetical protein
MEEAVDLSSDRLLIMNVHIMVYMNDYNYSRVVPVTNHHTL